MRNWRKAVSVVGVALILAAAPVAMARDAQPAQTSPAAAMGAKSFTGHEKTQLTHRQAVAEDQSRLFGGADTRNFVMDDEEAPWVYMVIIGGLTAALLVATL